MRSEDQIKRMIIQLEQTKQRLESVHESNELREIVARIEMLEWVLNAPTGKYHV
ncbi:hypothetical protein [Paenibacillus selenitireducens]|uniref:hypothetical protein n=1 Tax=Paenibacillus selenitireducens TaxID=1324314 RepID=UPI0018E9A90F|nr:hypothetical protein [Paenibacillus selenitireducens]